MNLQTAMWLLESHDQLPNDNTRAEIIDNLDLIVKLVVENHMNVTELESKIESIAEEVEDSYEDKIDELNSEVGDLEEEIQDLKDLICEIRKEHDEELAVADEKIDQLEINNDCLMREVENLNHDLEQANEYIQDLEDDG